MYGLLRENLATKLVALVMAVLIWFFAAVDRSPRGSMQRTVKAAITAVGQSSPDLIVRLRQDDALVTVTGPRAQVERLDDTSVKATATVSGVRADTTQVPLRYRFPPGVQVIGQQTVAVDVAPRVRRSFRVSAVFDDEPPAGTTFGTPRVTPQRVYVTGRKEDVSKVDQVVAFVETAGASVRAEIPLSALDANSMEIGGVSIEPARAHVEMTLRPALSTRTLVVDPQLGGLPAPPLTVASVRATPGQVVVTGRPEQLQTLAHIPTDLLDISGIRGSIAREVPLRLPNGVMVREGRPVVRVSVEVRDPTEVSP